MLGKDLSVGISVAKVEISTGEPVFGTGCSLQNRANKMGVHINGEGTVSVLRACVGFCQEYLYFILRITARKSCCVKPLRELETE